MFDSSFKSAKSLTILVGLLLFNPMVIKLDIDVGDIVLTGKFKNKRTKVKEIGTDDLGQPTINGKPMLKLRIEKLMPEDKQSKETRESFDEGFTADRFKQLAGLLKEQVDDEWTRNQMSLGDEFSLEDAIDAVEEAINVVYTMHGEDPDDVLVGNLMKTRDLLGTMLRHK